MGIIVVMWTLPLRGEERQLAIPFNSDGTNGRACRNNVRKTSAL